MRQIPQTNPGASFERSPDEIISAIRRVLEKGWYILGEETAAFEREWGDFLGTNPSVGVGNGTDALHLALRASGIQAGHAVMTTAHTAVATVAAIEAAGAVPVFADIDPEWMILGPSQLEDAIREYRKAGREQKALLRAVVVVHLYGQPADMAGILAVCERHGLQCLEDCAQSAGAAWKGKKTGTWGIAASFSFYPTKNLGAFGDGGAVTSRDPKILRRVRMLREYGWSQRNMSRFPGWNSRLDELQAAALRIRLRHLPEENDRRRFLAGIYRRLIRSPDLIHPQERPGGLSVYHQYVVRTRERNKLRCFLRSRGIGTNLHYPFPVHLQPAYRGRHWIPSGGLPATEAVARQVLSLPMHPYLSEEDLHQVVDALNGWSASIL